MVSTIAPGIISLLTRVNSVSLMLVISYSALSTVLCRPNSSTLSNSKKLSEPPPITEGVLQYSDALNAIKLTSLDQSTALISVIVSDIKES